LVGESVMRSTLIMAAAALAAVLADGSRACRAQSLNGSGSTFIAPIMDRWARDYQKVRDTKINYNPVGSGSGIRQFSEKETDFACSDVPLTADSLSKLQEKGGTVLHIPLVLGGVVPAYNLPGVKEPLRFTGP